MAENYEFYSVNSNIRKRARASVARILKSLQTHSSDEIPHCPQLSTSKNEASKDKVFDNLDDYDRVMSEGSVNYNDYDAVVSEVSESDSENSGGHVEESPDEAFKNSLTDWAIDFRITMVALTALLSILRSMHPNLPKDARTLLKTSTIYRIEQISGGSFYYFGILNTLSGIIDKILPQLPNRHTLTLQLNVDGIPLHKSSNMQLWPILGLLQGISKKPFVIAIFGGFSKPKILAEYLKSLIEEVKRLQSGFIFRGKELLLKISSVVCDAPARAYVKGVKSHTGYSSCDKCVQSGVYIQRRMTFPETNAALRTNETFRNMCDEEHHIIRSPLTELDMNMVSSFPHDYMHLVCLGVMRRLLDLWTSGPLKTRLPSHKVVKLSQNLLSLKSYVPPDFARKPRSIEEKNRWTTTELRQFLLYTGSVVLHDVVSTPVYNNFMLLSVAISILIDPTLCSVMCEYAKTLLIAFVEHFSQLYGKEYVVYNVHGLVHLADDVKCHGRLDNISGFPFENYLGQLKRLVRRPCYPVSQIVRRISEISSGGSKTDISKSYVRKEHCDGPILPFVKGAARQYKEMYLPDFCLKVSKGDNCVRIDSKIGLVQNIYIQNNDAYIVYAEFESVSRFYDYPVDSCQLGAYLVSNPSPELKCAKIDESLKKYVILPFQEKFACLPLLHLN